MASQQVWSFLPAAALLLLLSVHTSAEVVQLMSDCDEFFLDQTPPHVPGVLKDGKILDQDRYKPICQTYENQRRFFTLYDTKNKIPVFSAFRFVGDNKPESTTSRTKKNKPENWWNIEPQLEDKTADKNMQQGHKDEEYDHQAGDVDYRDNKGFDRGHLFPVSYASTSDDKESTFTLTNIVPQVTSFNQGSWNKMEQCVKCVMEKYCSGDIEGFVVTGAQPSSDRKLKNRVNIPSALWSAFCCYNANKKAWIASAHWGDNVEESKKKKENKILDTITLEALYQKLSMSNSGFLFSGNNCPLQMTITKFDPKIKNICSCP